MVPRTTKSTISFGHPFTLEGDGPWPAGLYELEVDEEPLATDGQQQGWRRVATILHVPGPRPGERQALRVDPATLAAAMAADAAATGGPPPAAPTPAAAPAVTAPMGEEQRERAWLTPPVLVPLAVLVGAALSAMFGPFGR